MKCALALAMLVLGGCERSHDCPDWLRPSVVKFGSSNPVENEIKVDDCLRETSAKLATGPSSDDNVARAVVTYCGFGWLGDDPAKQLEDSRASALMFVVQHRAYKCPAPRNRNILTGAFE